jgi:hypothetical protein
VEDEKKAKDELITELRDLRRHFARLSEKGTEAADKQTVTRPLGEDPQQDVQSYLDTVFRLRRYPCQSSAQNAGNKNRLRKV